MEEHIESPTTIKEVGIHVGYMREDISELKELIKEMPNTFATKSEVTDLRLRVIKLEAKNGIKTTLLWVGLVASAIINIVGAANVFGSK